MKNRIIAFTLFACIGITAEIFFTSFYDNITSVMEGRTWDWSLSGNSYVWMFFIYGPASFLIPFVMDKMGKLPLLARLVVYSIGIFAVEFASGFLLDKLTGACPWEYKTGLHIMGYIRLDYLPAWMGFSFLLEKLVVIFRELKLIPEAAKP